MRELFQDNRLNYFRIIAWIIPGKGENYSRKNERIIIKKSGELFQEKEKIIPRKMRELFQGKRRELFYENRENYFMKIERIIPGKMRELAYKPKAGHSFFTLHYPFFYIFNMCGHGSQVDFLQNYFKLFPHIVIL